MIQRSDGLAIRHGTVLVASASDSFLDILGYMIRRCGLNPESCAADEPAESSLSRTHPCLVICDGDLPETAAARMITEVTAQRVPLLVSMPHGLSEHSVGVLPGVQRLTFPVGQRAFASIVEALLEPAVQPVAPSSDTSSPID